MQLAQVARQLGLVPRTLGRGAIPARTLKRYRAEIRALFGTRQAAVLLPNAPAAWLVAQAEAQRPDNGPAPLDKAQLEAELARIDADDAAVQREIADTWWGTVEAGTWSPVPDISGAALLGLPG